MRAFIQHNTISAAPGTQMGYFLNVQDSSTDIKVEENDFIYTSGASVSGAMLINSSTSGFLHHDNTFIARPAGTPMVRDGASEIPARIDGTRSGMSIMNAPRSHCRSKARA